MTKNILDFFSCGLVSTSYLSVSVNFFSLDECGCIKLNWNVFYFVGALINIFGAIALGAPVGSQYVK